MGLRSNSNTVQQSSESQKVVTQNKKSKSVVDRNTQIPTFSLTNEEQESYEAARKKFYGVSNGIIII